MPALKPTDLQASALNAWTPLQQAALLRRQAAEQAELDERKAAEDERKKAKEEADKKKGKKPDTAPDSVTASEVLEGCIKWASPQLLDFLDLFGPPYIVFTVMVGLHLLFWLMAPTYMRSLLAYPTTYMIPCVQTHRTLFDKERRGNRPMWQAYWVVLALIEYAELCLFGEHRRGLVLWPLLKAAFCIWMYAALGSDSSGKKHTMGSIHLVGPFLPEPPADKDSEDKKADDKSGGSRDRKQR